MAELLAGAALGAVFGELLKAVSEAIQTCVNFKGTLTHLSTTLTRLGPKIQEIQKLNNELGRPKEELESQLISTMRDGKQLVGDCSKISRFNLVAWKRHEGKLQVLIKSIDRFIINCLLAQSARDSKETLCRMRRQEEQLLGLLLSAPNDSMTSLEKSSTNGIDSNAVTNEIKEVIVRGNLSVIVISAENLPALDFMTKSDPYVVLTLRKAKSKAETIYQTKVMNDCLNPFWNQTFKFVVEDGLHDEVIVEVWDRDTFGELKKGPPWLYLQVLRERMELICKLSVELDTAETLGSYHKEKFSEAVEWMDEVERFVDETMKLEQLPYQSLWTNSWCKDMISKIRKLRAKHEPKESKALVDDHEDYSKEPCLREEGTQNNVRSASSINMPTVEESK